MHIQLIGGKAKASEAVSCNVERYLTMNCQTSEVVASKLDDVMLVVSMINLAIVNGSSSSNGNWCART